MSTFLGALLPCSLCFSGPVDEFDSTFQFIVSQYSNLLFTPECYTVEPDTNAIIFNEKLFSEFKGDLLKDKTAIFEKHLIEKLFHDLAIRRERRLSSISSGRSRLPSVSTKRTNDDDKGNPSKLSKPSTS